MGKRKDLTGQKFGKLTVVSFSHVSIESNNSKRATWNCNCDCGGSIKVTTQKLTTGNTKSCGCLVVNNIASKTFNRLTAIRPTKEIDNGSIVWECICSCGGRKKVASIRLVSGQVQSCGCLSYKGYEDLSLSYFGALSRGAVNRDIHFDVTIEYLWNLFIKQDKKCALSGLDIVLTKSKKDESTASVDRIDSSLGYVEGNVQWVHKDVNKMKMDLDEQRFVKLCKAITLTKGERSELAELAAELL